MVFFKETLWSVTALLLVYALAHDCSSKRPLILKRERQRSEDLSNQLMRSRLTQLHST